MVRVGPNPNNQTLDQQSMAESSVMMKGGFGNDMSEMDAMSMADSSNIVRVDNFKNFDADSMAESTEMKR